MSTPIVYNGNSYSIPSYGDSGYAQGAGNLTSYLIALASGGLLLTGGTMQGNIAMNSHKLTGLSAGTGNGDSLRYEQVIGLYLLLTGGTMSGPIAMGTNKVTGIGNGTAAQDAAAYGQVAFLQRVTGTYATDASSSSTSYADTGIAITITPILSTTKVMIDVDVPVKIKQTSGSHAPSIDLIITDSANATIQQYLNVYAINNATAGTLYYTMVRIRASDTPGSTSAKTYKVRFRVNSTDSTNVVVDTCSADAGQSTAFISATEFR